MTGSDNMTTNCPSEETLAAFIDGRLPAEARREVAEHLVNCGDCRDTVLLADEMGASEAAASPAVVRGSFGRRWVPPLLAVAAAAVVVFSLPSVRQRLLRGGDVAMLVAASRDLPYRAIEGRASGGFEHRSLRPTLRGGSADPDLDAEIARQKFEMAAAKVAREGGDVHARGVAQLLLGQYDASVRTLEDAARERPSDPAVASDLSAAYAARARARGDARDAARAMAAAERSWAMRKSPETAWNRAVAASLSSDRPAAVKAWDDFLRIADDPAWRDEAVRRRVRLQEPP